MAATNAPQLGEKAPEADAGLAAVPHAICQDNAVLGLHFDQRLWLLREQAMSSTRTAEVLTMVSAVIALLVCLVFTVMIVLFLAGFTMASWSAGNGNDAVSYLIGITVGFAGAAVLVCLDAYCVLTLAATKRLFTYHYQLSWREMLYGEQTLLFAAEELHKILQLKVTNSTLLKLHTKPKHKSFGQMLQYCACHIQQLRKLARNPETRLASAALIRGQQVFGSQMMFQQTTGTYWIVGLMTLFFSNVIFVLAMFYVLYGPRYIISRAVLVAFLDYLLDQPMVRLDLLTPPDPRPLAWWQRLTAPWRQWSR